MENLYKNIIKGENKLNEKFIKFKFSEEEKKDLLAKNFNLLLYKKFINDQKFIDCLNIEIFNLNKLKTINIQKQSLFIEKNIKKLQYLNILKDLYYKYNKNVGNKL